MVGSPARSLALEGNSGITIQGTARPPAPHLNLEILETVFARLFALAGNLEIQETASASLLVQEGSLETQQQKLASLHVRLGPGRMEEQRFARLVLPLVLPAIPQLPHVPGVT